MLATGTQIGMMKRCAAGPLARRPGFGFRRASSVNLLLRRDRMPHLVVGLAGALSFPLMVVAAMGSGLPFGVASSLAVAHLAAAAPAANRAERDRLSRVVSLTSMLWALLVLASVAGAMLPLIFASEAALSLIVAASPFPIANLFQRRSRSNGTDRDIACLETFAAGEAVIITDRTGRPLGSTWAARSMTDGIGEPTDIVQIVERASRAAFSETFYRSALNRTVEQCTASLAGAQQAGPVNVTVKPVAGDRLAVTLARPAGTDQAFLSDPVQQARSGRLQQADKSTPADSELRHPECRSIDAGEVIGFAIRLAQADAERANVSVRFPAASKPVRIACNQRVLTQVVINLLNNAIKFSHHGGEIGIELRPVCGSALIRIADNGIGIAKDEQVRVFAAGHRSGDRRRAGHGLGLSIVSDLVNAAGGSIVLASEPGRGTTVDVRLPLAEAEPEIGQQCKSEKQEWQIAAE